MPENNDVTQFQLIENQQDALDTEGQLTFSVMSAIGMFPVANALITIANPNDPENILATIKKKKNLGASDEQIVFNLVKEFKFSEEEARTHLLNYNY